MQWCPKHQRHHIWLRATFVGLELWSLETEWRIRVTRALWGQGIVRRGAQDTTLGPPVRRMSEAGLPVRPPFCVNPPNTLGPGCRANFPDAPFKIGGACDCCGAVARGRGIASREALHHPPPPLWASPHEPDTHTIDATNRALVKAA